MLTSPGLFGGYPGPATYVHNVKGSDIFEQAAEGKAYPVGDGGGEALELEAFGGEHDLRSDPFTMMMPFEHGDLYLSSGRGGGGLGDPLLRSEERVADDVAGNAPDRALRRVGLRRGRPRRLPLEAPRARAAGRASGGPSSASGSSTAS